MKTLFTLVSLVLVGCGAEHGTPVLSAVSAELEKQKVKDDPKSVPDPEAPASVIVEPTGVVCLSDCAQPHETPCPEDIAVAQAQVMVEPVVQPTVEPVAQVTVQPTVAPIATSTPSPIFRAVWKDFDNWGHHSGVFPANAAWNVEIDLSQPRANDQFPHSDFCVDKIESGNLMICFSAVFDYQTYEKMAPKGWKPANRTIDQIRQELGVSYPGAIGYNQYDFYPLWTDKSELFAKVASGEISSTDPVFKLESYWYSYCDSVSSGVTANANVSWSAYDISYEWSAQWLRSHEATPRHIDSRCNEDHPGMIGVFSYTQWTPGFSNSQSPAGENMEARQLLGPTAYPVYEKIN